MVDTTDLMCGTAVRITTKGKTAVDSQGKRGSPWHVGGIPLQFRLRFVRGWVSELEMKMENRHSPVVR